MKLDSLCGKGALEQIRELKIKAEGDARQKFQHRHFGTKAVPNRAKLKSDRARTEIFEVLGYSNGADTVNLASRAGPKLFARVAEMVLTKRGLASLGRVLPVVAAPVSAWLNNKDIQRAGDAAVRYYGTLRQLPRRPAPA